MFARSPHRVVALGSAGFVVLAAQQDAGAGDIVPKVCPNGSGQHDEPVFHQPAELIPAVLGHHLAHVLLGIFGNANALRSGIAQHFPGHGAVNGGHMVQHPELFVAHVFALERGGVNGNKAAHLAGVSLNVRL